MLNKEAGGAPITDVSLIHDLADTQPGQFSVRARASRWERRGIKAKAFWWI